MRGNGTEPKVSLSKLHNFRRVARVWAVLVWLSGVFLDLGLFRDHWMTPILRQSNNCKCMVLWRDFHLIVHCLSWDFWWPLLFGSFSEGLLRKFHKRSFTRFMWFVKARLNLHEASELSRPQTWGLILVNWVYCVESSIPVVYVRCLPLKGEKHVIFPLGSLKSQRHPKSLDVSSNYEAV